MKKTGRLGKGNRSTALLLAVIAGLLTATGVLAAPAGSLDPAFGTNGFVITDLGSSSDMGGDVVLQPNGKILVAGSAQLDTQNSYHRTPFVVRYNTDGAVNTAYGTNGRVITEKGNFSGSHLAIQPDGKLVVGGSYRNDFGVARYYGDGTLDTSFGVNGIATIHISDDSRETCSDVAIQADGKIVLAGSEAIGNYINYAIARFNPDGTPDLSFNDRGFQLVWFDNNRYNDGMGVAIQEDQKIVMSGTMWTNYDPGDGPWLTLARFNPDGQLDTTFGTGGMVTSTVPNLQSNAGALALQADGKIVVGGTSLGATDDFAVARFNTDGTLDTTFGGTGVVISDFGNQEDGHAIDIQQDGKIVIAGKKYLANVTGFVLARYNTNGSIDTSFGTMGQVVSDFNGSAQSVNGLAIQTDGKILAGGSSNGNLALARYSAADTNVTTKTAVFRSLAAHDGWILESREASNLGGSLNWLASTFFVGDNAKDKQYRGLISFNTAPLPDSAIITAAQLRIKRQGIVGTDPMTTHGPLLLVMRKGAFGGSVSLQLADFSAAGSAGATKDSFAPLTYSWYQATLSDTNLGFIQKYGVTQFRLQFTKDDNDDMSADYLKIFSGNSVIGNQPQLIITYYLP